MSNINYLEVIDSLQSRVDTLKLDVQYEMHQREQANNKYLELAEAIKVFVDKVKPLIEQP